MPCQKVSKCKCVPAKKCRLTTDPWTVVTRKVKYFKQCCPKGSLFQTEASERIALRRGSVLCKPQKPFFTACPKTCKSSPTPA